MALIPKVTYAGQTIGSDPNYPEGKAQNVVIAGDGTGTPLEKDWVNDLWGFLQALLVRAGITPTGLPDQVGTSQYLDSLVQWLGSTQDLEQQPAEIGVMHARQDKTIDVSGEITTLTGMMASDDGVNAYALDLANDGISQYAMLQPWDGPTAVASGPYIVTEDTTPTSLFWSNSGTYYVVGGNTDTLYRYTFTGGSIVTSVYSGDSFDFSAQTTDAGSLTFNADRSKFYIGDNLNDRVHQYTAAFPGVLAGAAYDGFLDVSGEISGGLGPRGLAWDPDGSRLLVLGSGSGSNLYEYVTGGTPFDAVGAGYSGRSFDIGNAVANGSTNMDGIALTQGGMKMWAADLGERITLFDCGVIRTAL